MSFDAPAPGLCFVDPCAPHAYSSDPASLAGLGGTEMTLVTLVGELSRQVRIEVRQRARQAHRSEGRVHYAPFDIREPIAAPVIVVVNAYKVALSLARRNPSAQVFVWLHVVPGRHCRKMGRLLHDAGVRVVCVSHAHAAMLRGYLQAPLPRLDVVHNMIPDALRPDATPRNPDKLFFASAPHKGLDQVYAAFAEMRRRIPDLTLHLADPGYLAWDCGRPPEGVVALGRLERRQVWQHMRESLCLFYPQSRFAETFGIVLAEANAVGCPVLVQAGLGANDEVVSSPEQCLDVSDMDAIEARLRAWRARAPKIAGQERFRLSAVREAWWRLLGLDRDAAPRKRPVPALARGTERPALGV